MKPLLASLVLIISTAPAAAQQVWRCGPDGRMFSDRPCAEGRVFATGDKRSAEEVDAARNLASREQQLAESLASERRQRANLAAGAGLMSIGPSETELQAERRDREVKRQRGSKRQSVKRHRSSSDAGI